MSHLAKAYAFLNNATVAELDEMPTADQRRIAELCYHWWVLADRRARQASPPKIGILRDLSDGQRAS
jgi:hypothetical protein